MGPSRTNNTSTSPPISDNNPTAKEPIIKANTFGKNVSKENVNPLFNGLPRSEAEKGKPLKERSVSLLKKALYYIGSHFSKKTNTRYSSIKIKEAMEQFEQGNVNKGSKILENLYSHISPNRLEKTRFDEIKNSYNNACSVSFTKELNENKHNCLGQLLADKIDLNDINIFFGEYSNEIKSSPKKYNPKNTKIILNYYREISANNMTYGHALREGNLKHLNNIEKKIKTYNTKKVLKDINLAYQQLDRYDMGLHSGSTIVQDTEKKFNSFLNDNRSDIGRIFAKDFADKGLDTSLIINWVDKNLSKSINPHKLFNVQKFINDLNDFTKQCENERFQQQESRNNSPNSENKPLTIEQKRAILGFSKNEPLNLRTLKKAYFKRALKTHPDKTGGDKEPFQELQNAYEELKSHCPK